MKVNVVTPGVDKFAIKELLFQDVQQHDYHIINNILI